MKRLLGVEEVAKEVPGASPKSRSFGLHPRMAIAVVSAASKEAS
ncbi:MAG TPA: hypothetical protein VE093_40125 [Polyangiaceae bacterium]|nr:hypothetical protein [Polyangiaceae bacterium]